MADQNESRPSRSESLPREQRIGKRRDFLLAYEEGRKRFSRYSVIFVRPNELGFPRIGITAPKRVGKAHVRNRAKRWVREVFRREKKDPAIGRKSVDFVVNLKTNVASAAFQEFADDLRRGLRRAAADLDREQKAE